MDVGIDMTNFHLSREEQDPLGCETTTQLMRVLFNVLGKIAVAWNRHVHGFAIG